MLSDSSTLGDNEVTVEINRNSLYKMMMDTTQADYRVNVTNSYLAATSGTSTAIQIVGSRPMYVQRFEITRDVMDTDIRIYVNAETLSDIFVALQPDIDALEGTTSSAGVPSQFYFEIKTEGGEQLKNLTSTLSGLGIRSIDIGALYARENAEIMSEATNNLSIFFVVLALLLIVVLYRKIREHTKQQGIRHLPRDRREQEQSSVQRDADGARQQHDRVYRVLSHRVCAHVRAVCGHEHGVRTIRRHCAGRYGNRRTFHACYIAHPVSVRAVADARRDTLPLRYMTG